MRIGNKVFNCLIGIFIGLSVVFQIKCFVDFNKLSNYENAIAICEVRGTQKVLKFFVDDEEHEVDISNEIGLSNKAGDTIKIYYNPDNINSYLFAITIKGDLIIAFVCLMLSFTIKIFNI